MAEQQQGARHRDRGSARNKWRACLARKPGIGTAGTVMCSEIEVEVIMAVLAASEELLSEE